jgi:hypothetical protein
MHFNFYSVLNAQSSMAVVFITIYSELFIFTTLVAMAINMANKFIEVW